jgi:hypothetical protein
MNKAGTAALLIVAVSTILLVAGVQDEAFLFPYAAFFLLFIYLGISGSRWWLLPAGLQLTFALWTLWALSQGH